MVKTQKLACALLALILSWATSAAAQGDAKPADEDAASSESGDPSGPQTPSPQPAPSAAETTEEKNLARAKDLFRQGVALYEAKDIERALDKFQRSRAFFPSSINTRNAALCLDKLGRHAEALELYEITIAEFTKELSEGARAKITAAMVTLRTKVGTLEVSANVEGNLVIDGRRRGKLPLTMPLRVMPGPHVVRIIKDGYATFEQEIVVEAQKVASIDARLKALETSGGLRVEDPTNPDAEVIVDGAVVGAAPWEGTFAPGPHVVQTRSAELVSRPVKAVLVRGQTTLLRLKSEPLGPDTFLSVLPATAELALDGVPLGRGRWQGTLPAGKYRLTAHEEGYFVEQKVFTVKPGQAAAERIALRLRVDRDHPRWPHQPIGSFWVRGTASVALGSGLGSGPEGSCPSNCTSDPVTTGFLVGLRAGFEFPFNLSLEIGGGYLSLVKDLDRGETQRFPKGTPTYTTTYRLNDIVRFKGPLVGGGASYRIALGKQWSLVGRTHAGALFVTSTDTLTGVATSGQEEQDALIPGADESVSTATLFVMPELAVDYAIGSWRLGVALPLIVVPLDGPTLPRSRITVQPDCTEDNPGALGCTPDSSVIADERAFGPFAVFAPQLSVGYTF